ncbi:MAG: hypothetical protein KC454_06255 [Flavobacteriales bacterium]|nr:hypothetical protein [Flavobacteriales bacterium]
MSKNIFTRSIFKNVESIPKEDWEKVRGGRNIYLSINYLSSIEVAMKDKIDFFYEISYNSEQTPVLISVFQLVQFVDKRKVYSAQLCKLSYHLSKKLTEALTINVLVCGSVFADGENGFLWDTSITSQEAMEEIDSVTSHLKSEEKIKDKASVTLFKDFWPKSSSIAEQLKRFSYRDFMVDVNMVLDIHESWVSFDDYLSSMKTKFRTRAKSVYKKSDHLILKQLNTTQIIDNKERLQELFDNVLEKSDFSFGNLDVSSFIEFSDKLKTEFTITGAYLNEDLVGFSTSFLNGDSLEANYVGLDYSFNTKHNVYQRLLYNYVEQAISAKVKDLQLGRTSELIKSSIGALPTNMTLYIKHKSTVSNLLLKPIIQSISPSEFELRKPFKANFSN